MNPQIENGKQRRMKISWWDYIWYAPMAVRQYFYDRRVRRAAGHGRSTDTNC